jgi:hypothetical protein
VCDDKLFPSLWSNLLPSSCNLFNLANVADGAGRRKCVLVLGMCARLVARRVGNLLGAPASR